MKAIRPATTMRQSLTTTPISSAMPTDRKKSPSRMARNGSTSASSWCLNVESDSSTPARKAPMAIDRPTSFMIQAVPATTSKAAAVITSRPPFWARKRNTGLIA